MKLLVIASLMLPLSFAASASLPTSSFFTTGKNGPFSNNKSGLRHLSLMNDWAISLSSKEYDDTNSLFRIVYDHGSAASGINVAFYTGGDPNGNLVGAACRTGGGKKIGDLSNPPPGLKASLSDQSASATIEVSIDMDTITNDTSVATTSGNSLVVHFCVCTSLMNGQEEANFVEMELRFTQDSGDGTFTLAADFETQAQEAGSVEHSTTLSTLTAKLCDGMTQPIHPGTPVEVCVETSSDSLVSILGIRQFSFKSKNGVTQTAFNAGAADPLTEIMSCDSGSVCSFRTLLLADFFLDTTVPVSGSGTADLDTGSGRRTQQLRRETYFLQEDHEGQQNKASTDFSFTMLLAREGNNGVGFEAYDMDKSDAFKRRASLLLLAGMCLAGLSFILY